MESLAVLGIVFLLVNFAISAIAIGCDYREGAKVIFVIDLFLAIILFVGWLII